MAMTTDPTRSDDRRWTLPNILTYGRVVAVPVVVVLLFWPDRRLGALDGARASSSSPAITDFFDGYLARAWSQQSSLGRMLDPIADKLLVAAVLLMLVADHTIAGWSIWAAIVILCREILVSGLREYLAELQVSRAGDARSPNGRRRVQLVALGFLIAGPAGEKIAAGRRRRSASALLWIAALLTLYTGWDYMKAGLQARRRRTCASARMKASISPGCASGSARPRRRSTPPADVATVADLIALARSARRGIRLRLRECRSRSAPRSTARMSSTTRRSPARARSPSSRR